MRQYENDAHIYKDTNDLSEILWKKPYYVHGSLSKQLAIIYNISYKLDYQQIALSLSIHTHRYTHIQTCMCMCVYHIVEEDFCKKEASATKCLNKGVCVTEVGDYHCDCPTGFGGKICDIGTVIIFFKNTHN